MGVIVAKPGRYAFLALWIIAVSVLLLQGCALLGLTAPEKHTGQGTRRVLAGTEAEVRAGFHALFAKIGSEFAIADRGSLVQATYQSSVVALRYKALLTPAPEPGKTEVEMFCEMPGSVKADAIRECETNFLNGVVETLELAQLRKTASSTEVARTGAGRDTPTTGSDVDELPATRTPQAEHRYAVVIGIEQYRQQLPRADFARHDAQAVTDYLTTVLGYRGENVVTLLDERATHVDFAKYFEKWLPNRVEPGASVFVYYSGHGAPNPRTGDAYLVPYDGDPAFIDETGYSLKRLYAALGKLPAKEVVVALDSCFSGAGGRSVIAKGTRSISLNLKEQAPLASNMTVLAASSGEQTSSTYAEKGHGLFTYFLLKGIKHEDVIASDGSLRLGDLFAYLRPQVERVARREFNNEQTPQLLGAGR